VSDEPPTRPYAGFATRAVGLVVDVVIIDVLTIVGAAITALVLDTIIPGDVRLGTGGVITAGIVWFVSVGGYFVGFWTLVGRTPGMRFMRLEVLSAGGGDVGLGRASLRFIGLIVAAIPLGAGFLLALVDDRRQALQDKIAGTIVLYTVPGLRGVVVEAAPEALPARQETAEAGEVVEGTVVPPGARPA
jgi:uncharacterized RDD family membrane protein YckC